MRYYVDNGKGYRRMFTNIQDARKSAITLLESAVMDGPSRVKEVIYTTSDGVPIYTGKYQRANECRRFVNYYDWKHKEHGFEYSEWNPAYGTKHVPLYKNGKVMRG